eukprot:2006573-Amphidinium_carterae.1
MANENQQCLKPLPFSRIHLPPKPPNTSWKRCTSTTGTKRFPPCHLHALGFSLLAPPRDPPRKEGSLPLHNSLGSGLWGTLGLGAV